jgi:hypothetical protein
MRQRTTTEYKGVSTHRPFVDSSAVVEASLRVSGGDAQRRDLEELPREERGRGGFLSVAWMLDWRECQEQQSAMNMEEIKKRRRGGWGVGDHRRRHFLNGC